MKFGGVICAVRKEKHVAFQLDKSENNDRQETMTGTMVR